MKKHALRKDFLHRRAELSNSEKSDLEWRIFERFIHGIEFGSALFLHHFIPLKSKAEIEVLRLVELISERVEVLTAVVPRVDAETGELVHLAIEGDTTFAESSMGILEPVGSELVTEDRIDLVLVPLLCFDRTGHRVGYGGGYYDRFLSRCRPDCLKVGLSFFDPVEAIDDVDENDVRLDFCVTPHEVYEFR